MSGMRLTWLATRRELREGVRGKTFLVSSVFVLLLLAGMIALGALTGGGATVTIAVAGAPPEGLRPALDAAARPYDTTVRIRRYETAAAARDAVVHRKVDGALLGRRLVVRRSPYHDVVPIVVAAERTLALPQRFEALGLSRQQAQALLAPPVAVTEVAGAGSDTQAQAASFVGAVLLFVSISLYGQAVMMGVVQEKAGRVVEVLLSALRPRHLLVGKVAGIGLLGLVQLALIVVAALAAGALGVFDVPSLGRAAPLAVIWFLLGFALYAVAFAAVGALVSRLEDASAAAAPVTGVMIVCYLGSFAALSNPDRPLALLLTLLPPSAPFVVPARVAATTVPVWQLGVSFVSMLAAIWACIRLGGRIYELGLLRGGPRVPLREALRAAVAR